jgi:hypothetical protein
MRYFSIMLLGFTLWACESINAEGNDTETTEMGGEASSAGAGGSAGVIACGASVCGACEEGCRANDQCVDGEWQCRCECGEGGSGGSGT